MSDDYGIIFTDKIGLSVLEGYFFVCDLCLISDSKLDFEGTIEHTPYGDWVAKANIPNYGEFENAGVTAQWAVIDLCLAVQTAKPNVQNPNS